MSTHDHISSTVIEQDIADTEQEIAQMEREAEYYDKSPVGSPSYRLDHMRADARRSGIKERKEFIVKLQAILDERAQERQRGEMRMAFREDDYITVIGPRWRVKLSISDYSECAIESQRVIPTSFWIQILPADWPKNASFGSYGACQKKFSFHDMVAHAEALSGQQIKIPRRWERYVLPQGR